MNDQNPQHTEFSSHRNFSIVLGTAFRRAAESRYGIRKKDSNRHAYVIGKTGTGKSQLLQNSCTQLIHRNQGVTVVDPHNDLASNLLSAVPASRAASTIYVSANDSEFPTAFNPLRKTCGAQLATRAASITRAISSIWSDSWGPRSQYILEHSLLTLLYGQNSTFLDLARLFRDDKFREGLIRKGSRNISIRMFWNEFNGWSNRYRAEATGPIMNKIQQLLANSQIRNILCQNRKLFDPFTAMNDGKIVLIDLAKGQIGHEASSLLGALIVSAYEEAGLARSSLPIEQRRHHWLILDEFQSVTTQAFADMLSELRKFHVHIWLANQYLDQIHPAVRSSIFGNVGSLIAFQTGARDAKILAEEMGWPEGTSSLVDLDRYEVIARLIEKGAGQPPFIGKTMAPLAINENNAQAIIDHTRKNYCSRREDVENWIKQNDHVANAPKNMYS